MTADKRAKVERALIHADVGIDVYREVVDMIKNAERYAWHDLRKNPQDLPEPEKEVDVVCERKMLRKDSKPIQIRTHGFYEDGTILENDSEWNWEDLEGEYNEEEDCYVIQEGWWEFRHYGLDEFYNNVIDDEIVAWRYIEQFEG